jgi:hypothetical protein
MRNRSVSCSRAAYYGTGGGGKGTVGTVTVTVRMGVETVVDGGTAVVTDATGAVTARTVLAAVPACRGDTEVSLCGAAVAGAPLAETASFVGALWSAPCPVTAGRE